MRQRRQGEKERRKGEKSSMSLWSKDKRKKKEFKFTSASDGKFFSPGKTKEKREKTKEKRQEG